MKKILTGSIITCGMASTSFGAITAITAVDNLANVASVTAGSTISVTSGTVRGYGNAAFATGTPVIPGGSTHAELNDSSILTGVSGTGGFTNGDYSLSFNTNVTDNDAALDFFFFEDGGNDSGTIYAVLADGSVSSGLAFTSASFGSAITATGVLNNNGATLTGRNVEGFAFAFTDLGITNGTEIQGIVVDTGATADAYGIFANVDAVPEPSSTALLGLGGLALILRRRK